MNNKISDNTLLKFDSFGTNSGEEYFYSLEADPGLGFAESVSAILNESVRFQKELSLDSSTEVSLRFYLCDIAKQATYLNRELKRRDIVSFVSLIGQPPDSASKIAMQGYHIKSNNTVSKKITVGNTLEVTHGNYRSLLTRICPGEPGTSYEQTWDIFNKLSEIIDRHGGKMEDDLHRTWIYVRDIDNNYQGMVDSRGKLFTEIGLNQQTHYIASTGIEGIGEVASDLVIMDSLAILGLEDGQVEYMQALDHLNSTYEYGVTFERGTRIVYGDRSHCYISGTASIDQNGNVLYEGDIKKQTGRTLTNIQALLENYGTDWNDMKTLIVYLRDVSDAPLVREILSVELPVSLPCVIVRGAVCRPSWLIEMEGIAVSPLGDSRFKPFC